MVRPRRCAASLRSSPLWSPARGSYDQPGCHWHHHDERLSGYGHGGFNLKLRPTWEDESEDVPSQQRSTSLAGLRLGLSARASGPGLWHSLAGSDRQSLKHQTFFSCRISTGKQL